MRTIYLLFSFIISIILLLFSVIQREFKYGGGADTIGDLECEYRRYTYVKKILDHIYADNERENYEIRNIVERWLLSMVNFSDDLFDSVFSNDILQPECRFNIQMMTELREKTRYTEDEINKIMRAVISYVEEYKNIMYEPCTNADFSLTNTFTYRDYTREIAPERLSLLLSRATPQQVAKMLLRYASILPGAQHWNMPRENYQTYYDRGITIEGFASPINAQLITIDSKCSFCSLFPDVDFPFGSIGNFFDIDFVGKKVAVGPPYTVELFEKIALKLISDCNRADETGQSILFYVTFAAWEDTNGFKLLRDSKWCEFAAILPAREHFYVNTNKSNQPKVIASFNTVFFLLNVSNQTANSLKLFNNMSTRGHIKLKILKK